MTTAAAPASTTTTATAPKGPATASLTLVGDSGLSGLVGTATIRCSLPMLDGTEILIIGPSPDKNVSTRIMLTNGTVTVGVDSGSGAQYRERDFTGAVITNFNPATGATLDSTLTEVPPAPGSPTSSLGAVMSISGTVDCGNQTPGVSTAMLTGDTSAGSVTGGINPVNVSCTKSTALVLGLVTIGGARALIDMYVATGTFSFFVVTRPTHPVGQFKAGAGTSTQTSSGFHIDGDAAETVAAGAAPHTVHIVGDLTCP